MAGVSWAEGVSNRTNFLISSGTNFLISSGTNFLISNGTNASSGGVLGADLQHSLLAVSYSLVLLLGLVGNALSLWLLPCRVKPLSHSYVLLLQVALLDSLLLAVLPLHIHSQLLGDTWAFGDAACGVCRALFCLHTSLSVAFLGCLALDLWLAVLHPFTSIQLRATHYVLVAAVLWLVALGATVPLLLHSTGLRGCFGSSPVSWAQPTAPHTVLALLFGVVVPLSTILLAFPVLAASVWRSRRRARRKVLGTICIMLGICALCFLPLLLSQLLQLLLGLQGIPEESFPGLIPEIQRVAEFLASCSCCLNPLLYHFHCSSSPWHCPCRLSLRPTRVFTICDQNFGDPSWVYKPRQRLGRKNPRGWNQLIHSRYSQS